MVRLEQLIYHTYSKLLKRCNNSPSKILFFNSFLGVLWDFFLGGGDDFHVANTYYLILLWNNKQYVFVKPETYILSYFCFSCLHVYSL